MKILHTLFCFFFLSLQHRNTVCALLVYTGAEGGNVTVQCQFFSSGTRTFFCKGKCKQENILIETTGVSARSARYSIRYYRGISGGNVFMTIKQLNKSDSGLYNCGLDRTWSSTLFAQFEIIVVDALLDGSRDSSEVKPLYTRTGTNITVRCSFSFTGSRKFFCKEQCEQKGILVQTYGEGVQIGRYSIRYLSGGFVYVTITQLKKSDSGQYRCGLDRSYQRFEVIVKDDNVMLYVGMALLVMVLLLSVLVLIFCRKRSSKAKEPAVETDHVSVPETNQVYEDIRQEDGQSKALPVEISAVHTYAKYTKPNGAETTDDYSFLTAASPRNKDEDESDKLTYSEVNFSNRTVDSPNSAPCDRDNDVVYSVPRVGGGSDASYSRDDPPLYSIVT